MKSLRDSNVHQQQPLMGSKLGSMKPIDENQLELSESERSEKLQSDSDDDGFGRSQEKIDLDQVEVKSSLLGSQRSQKPILT